MKKPTITMIFRVWLEDWEKELLQVNDCVAKARILEKNKDFMIFDPDTGQTFKVWGRNLEFLRGSLRTGVEKGWGLVCIQEVIELIGSDEQADEIEEIHREGEGGLEIAAM